MILSWVAMSSADGLASSATSLTCCRASACRRAWIISPKASLPTTRLIVSRSGSSVAPINSVTAVAAFCTATCWPRMSAASVPASASVELLGKPAAAARP